MPIEKQSTMIRVRTETLSKLRRIAAIDRRSLVEVLDVLADERLRKEPKRRDTSKL
jgi:hypothetical protein